MLCLGHLRRIFPLLDRLHDVGCDRDSAGNRRLFFSDYCKLMLVYIWNPDLPHQNLARLGSVQFCLASKASGLT